MKKAVIALDIGGTKVLGALFDEETNIIKRKKKATKASAGTEMILEQISKVIAGLIETAEENEYQVMGIGAGVPGVIKDGTVLFTPNLPWENYPLADEIASRFNLPILIGNDANVSLLGEWGHGIARNTVNTLGFFVGTGVGGGIIINSKIYTGNMGLAGEIGHISLNPDGIICGCGSRGCLESYASKTGMLKYIKSQIAHGRDCKIKQELENNPLHYILRSSVIKDALDEGDMVITEAVQIAAKYLGIAVASGINILNPEMVVFGGGIVEAIGQPFIDMLRPYVYQYAVPHAMDNCLFKLAELGDDACLYGGLTLLEDTMK
ncbi:MAG TPA: ROK family protein [Thermotogota bacterium]|nr:ROK family protein [Thermotogota bacterium]HPJ87506.1 ROK family protein [Thermotogota bacterium]HPR94711.1 ROK family protein [Thermotogota bacterium]